MNFSPSSKKLSLEKIREILGKEGPLSKSLKGFEIRDQQLSMLIEVAKALNENQVALFEAGTGTGKSFAYLVPFLLWAALNNEHVVISTHTINLQEQLIHKDIPRILEALQLQLKVVLVKGMGNYLCLRKVEETKEELRFFQDEEAEEIQKIIDWSDTHPEEGCKSKLPFGVSVSSWEQVNADESCTNIECPYFQKCYFIKARKEVEEAHIYVVNHHLLFADLAAKKEAREKKEGIIPEYKRIVIDEAHNIEEIATEFFGDRISQIEIHYLLAKLYKGSREKPKGKLPFLLEKIQQHLLKHPNEEGKKIIQTLAIDLPALRNDLTVQISQAFSAIGMFIDLMGVKKEEATAVEEGSKLRLLPNHRQESFWKKEIETLFANLSQSIKHFILSIRNVDSQLSSIKHTSLKQSTDGILAEIRMIASRLEEFSLLTEKMIFLEGDANIVQWLEKYKYKQSQNAIFIHAHLDVSELLATNLHRKFPTVVLCSATLTAQHQFNFIRQRLGIIPSLVPHKTIVEHQYESPFDYKKQVFLGVVNNLPDPFQEDFFESAVESLWKILQACRGNAFVLFTSYNQLIRFHHSLADRLKKLKFHVLRQGEESRNSLLNRFRQQNGSILFGTSSFWEGVDVVGDALRCVVIVKLPFQVPTEPIVQARSEALSAKGFDPFIYYSLPQAIMRFKQGFGRLIRTKRDRGCVICLDKRIVTKQYGKTFLESLPDCEKCVLDIDDLTEKMRQFYKKTHYLLNGA